MSLEITEVTRTGDYELLKNFHLDSPTVGASAGHLIELSGWVVGRAEVVAVDVRTDTAVIARATLGTPRPDVPAALPELDAPANCGFRGMVATLGLPERFALQVVVHFADGSMTALGEITGTRTRLPAPAAGPLEPLLVTSLGRSGSTWLMHLLGCHPEVVIFDEWSYELKGLKFFEERFLHTVTRPHGAEEPPGFGFGRKSWWGQHPFGAPAAEAWFRGEQVERAVRECRDGVVSFYRAIADGQGKPGARYFAEKAAPQGIGLTMELFGGPREIILVRDFRDTVSSILAYNRKHGLREFNADLVTADVDLPRVLAPQVNVMVAAARERPESLVVRYEDLVTDSRTTLSRILDHLGLPSDPAVVDRTLAAANEQVAHMANHRTTEDQAASVGRWRTDLAPEVAAACDTAFADALEAFGYLDPRPSRGRLFRHRA